MSGFADGKGASSTACPTAAALLIVAAGALAYGNSLGGPFVFDDATSITGNSTIRHIWPVWEALRPPVGEGITVSGRPVLNLSFAVNYAISGTRVWSYHAVNVLIHVLAGLTLFAIARRTLGRSRAAGAGLGATALAFFVALIWTVHPLQTEAVTYTVQRAESLMGLFYLLTIYCFLRGAGDERGSFRWLGLSWLACLLGMGTKEVMVTAPVVVFLADRSFVAGSFREAWRLRWKYHLALFSTWIPLAWLVAGTGGNRGGSAGFGVAVSPVAYALTQFPAIAHYLRLAIWPHPLVFDYESFWIENAAQVLLPAAVVLALLAGTIWALCFRPALGFVGAFFFLILAPTSLTPGTTQMIAEHRMYLPLAAVLALIVWALDRVMAGDPRRKLLVAVVLLAAAATAGALTFQRNKAYATELALWADTVAKRPLNASAQNNLGIQLTQAGRPLEAIPHFEKALRISPKLAEAEYNLGIALGNTGEADEAIDAYAAAVRLAPDLAEARLNLGNILARTGRVPEAIVQFEEAVRIRPGYVDAHFNLGNALVLAGRYEEAAAQYEAGLRLRPGDERIRQTLLRLQEMAPGLRN
jgi:tetratricopeptide (TPR) repeat protein